MSFNFATGGGDTNLPAHYISKGNENNSGSSSSQHYGNNNNTDNNNGSSSSGQSQNQRQAQKSRIPPKLGACTECHKSKNKCVFSKEAQDFFNQVLALQDANSSTTGNDATSNNEDDDDDDGNSTNNDGNNVVAILQGLDPSLRPRCERCARLNKECLPHISRQGKRRKNRKDKDGAHSASSSSSSSGKKKGDGGAGDGDEEKTSRLAAPDTDDTSGNGFEGFDSNTSSNGINNGIAGGFNSAAQSNNMGRDRSVSAEFNNLLAALRRKQSQNQSQQQQQQQQQQNTSVQNQHFHQQQQQQQQLQQLQQLQQQKQQQQQQRLQQLQQLQQQRHHGFQPPQAKDNPHPNNNDFSQRYQNMLPSYQASNTTTNNNNNSNNSQEESIRILLNQINNGNHNNNNNNIMSGNFNGDIPNAGNGMGMGLIPSLAHSAGNIHRGSLGSDNGANINHNSNSYMQMPHSGRIHLNTTVGNGLDNRSIDGNNDWMQGNNNGIGNNSIINNNGNLGNLGLVRSALDMNRRQSSGRSSTDYNNSSYDDNNNNNNNNATTNNIYNNNNNNNNNNIDTLNNSKNSIMPGSVSNALLLLARKGSDVSSSLGVDVGNGNGTPTISNHSNNLNGSNNIMSNYENMSHVLKNYLSKVTNSNINNSNNNITSNNIKDGNVNDNVNSANDSGSKNNPSVGFSGRNGYIRTSSNGNAHISSRPNTANDALNADCGASTKTHSSTAADDNHVEFDCDILPYKKQKRPRLSAVDEEATCKRGASQNRSSGRGASALSSSCNCRAGDGNGQNDVGESCFKHESIEGESLSRSSSSVFVGPEDTIGNAITKACAKNAGKSLTSLKYHYGLQCQIREWISMALVRRSFALLGKASTLANRCGIHMDRILCGIPEEEDHENDQDSYKPERNNNIGRRMNYLLAELLEPRSQQKIPLLERHMLSPRLSSDVLAMVGCQSCPTFQEQEMRNRWIIIRETHCGKSSFYCSPAFEQNVLCWSHISQIYEDNLADINSLIFVRDDFRRLIACVAQQLSSHSVEGMPPRPVHAPKTTVRLLSRQLSQSNCGAQDVVRKARGNDVMTLEMDLLVILIPTMDKTTYYLELFHRSCDGDGDDYLIDDAENQSSRRASNNINAGDDSPFKKSGMGDIQNRYMQGRLRGDDSNPPTFDDVVESEEWVGIDDVLASGDIDDLITALCD